MQSAFRCICLGLVTAVVASSAVFAQEAVVTPVTVSVVPHVVKYSGALPDAPAAASVVEVKFAMYAAQNGGEALWTETQQVALDPQSRYSVLLGSTVPAGLPQNLFANGEPRWLGVTLGGQEELPRTLLAASAYSLKASDAETLNGHPATDFALAKAKPDSGVDITQINAGTGITVSGNGTATVTVGVNSTYLESLAANFAVTNAANTFKASQAIQGNLSVTGTLTVNGTINSAYLNGIAATLPTLAGNNTFSGTNKFSKAVTFASGQTFPGVAKDSGNNTFTGNQTVNGTEVISGSASDLGQLSVTDSSTSNLAVAIVGNGRIGVEGAGNASTGYGVYGTGATGLLGVGGAADNANTVTGTGVGVEGQGGVGVYGVTTYSGNDMAAIGVEGAIPSGFTSGSETAYGVYGTDSSTAGYYGVYGTSTNGYGTAGVTSGDGAGVYGQSTGGTGVAGTTAANGGYVGVFGSSTATTVNSNGFPGIGAAGTAAGPSSYGVYGESDGSAGEGLHGIAMDAAGYGVHGVGVNASTTGGLISGDGAGVWGDTSESGQYTYGGIVGSADDANAGFFVNNSSYSGSDSPTIFALNFGNAGTGTSVPVLSAAGRNGGCGVNSNGDVTCSGQIKTAVPAEGGAKQVEVYAVESAENWFEDAGSGKLTNGTGKVNVEAVFGSTVNTGAEYHVFLTPNGDCKGLYVANKTATGFEVRELGGGHSSVSFDWRIMAKRAGHENERLADATAEMHGMTARRDQLLQRMAENRTRKPGPNPALIKLITPRAPRMLPPRPIRAGISLRNPNGASAARENVKPKQN